MELKSLRSVVCWGLMGVAMVSNGCSTSQKIVNLVPAQDQPSLQELETHLNYVDPDAGQPDYRRDD